MNEITTRDDNTPQPVNYSPATVQTVRETIFKGANDAELQLFFHKCLSVGCHPLDGLIHPSKFQDGNQGGTRVVFLTTIDLFRARAEDTGKYDGQDEPEFEHGDIGDDDFVHPTYCRINIYKKGIDRPTVGTADWDEFYPSEPKKQFMWKKMPKVMLAKCAEAQGLRKAFPQALNKLYAEEEMMQAIQGASGRNASTKPAITQQTEVVAPGPVVDGQVISDVEYKTGTGKKGKWERWGVLIDGVKYGTFDKKLGELAIELKEKGASVGIEFEKKGNYQNLTNLWEELAPANEEAPPVEDTDDFLKNVRDLGKKAGFKDDTALNEYLTERSFPVITEINADLQNAVVDMLIAEAGPQ